MMFTEGISIDIQSGVDVARRRLETQFNQIALRLFC